MQAQDEPGRMKVYIAEEQMVSAAHGVDCSLQRPVGGACVVMAIDDGERIGVTTGSIPKASVRETRMATNLCQAVRLSSGRARSELRMSAGRTIVERIADG